MAKKGLVILEVRGMEGMEGQVEEDQMNVEEIEKDMETVEKEIHTVAAVDGNAKLKDR